MRFSQLKKNEDIGPCTLVQKGILPKPPTAAPFGFRHSGPVGNLVSVEGMRRCLVPSKRKWTL